MYCRSFLFFFFFQAEDGIRDYKVTGVQTCALPVSSSASRDRLENSENYQTEPEINHQSRVNVTRHVPRSRRQIRNQDKVNGISRQNGDQSLNEISHCGFGHRSPRISARGLGRLGTWHLAISI